MIIRHSTSQDIDRIMEIYRDPRESEIREYGRRMQAFDGLHYSG